MSKFLKIFLFFIVLLLVIRGVLYIAGISIELAEPQKTAESFAEKENPKKTPEQIKMEDFQQRHDRLKSLPSRSYRDGSLDYSNYPDDYYNKTQQLYREEIAFIVEQYGEEATAKVVFLLNQIPVTGQYFIGKIEVDEAGLRYHWAHKYHPEAFDAVCAQIAHKTINSICDYALGLAMGYGYKQMAQSIIRCYKPDIVITKTKDQLTYDTDEYKVSTTYRSRDDAKARIAAL